MKYILLIAIAMLSMNIFSQVGINNPTPDPAAALDIQANDKGILIPRMSTAERTTLGNVPPPVGLLVFDNDTESFWMFKTGGWSELSNGDNDKDPNNEAIESFEWLPNGRTFRITEGGSFHDLFFANAFRQLLMENDHIIRDYINSNCRIYFGWRDNCSGCNSVPTKYGRINDSSGQTVGTDGDVSVHNLFGEAVRMYGLNTDGDVDGSDKFWIGFKCE